MTKLTDIPSHIVAGTDSSVTTNKRTKTPAHIIRRSYYVRNKDKILAKQAEKRIKNKELGISKPQNIDRKKHNANVRGYYERKRQERYENDELYRTRVQLKQLRSELQEQKSALKEMKVTIKEKAQKIKDLETRLTTLLEYV
jgi:hypothetical protein